MTNRVQHSPDLLHTANIAGHTLEGGQRPALPVEFVSYKLYR